MNTEKNNITKGEYKKALEAGKIYITGSKYTSNGWTQFKVWRLFKNKLIPIWVNCPYANEKNWDYRCVAFGTNRQLEIILSIGYELGLEFNEITQNYRLLF